MFPRVLIVGGSGLLGTALRQAAPFAVLTPSHSEFDALNAAAVRDAIAHFKPHLVVNCAAFSAVDGCEQNPALAQAMNVQAVQHLVDACDTHGASLIHFSTDYVFDGLKSTPYTEADTPNPINTYGQSKRRGEQAVLASPGAHVVLRVSWLYGQHGKNFFSAVRQQLQQAGELRVVDDQVSVPNNVDALAAVFWQWLSQPVPALLAMLNKHCGVYHFTSARVQSRFAYAKMVADQLGTEARAKLIPVSAASFPALAKRPAYTAMSGDLFSRTFGLTLPG